MNYLTAQGWLEPEERQCLYDCAKHLPAGSSMINVGIEFGASLVCLREGLPDGPLIGIDLIGDSLLSTHVINLTVIKGNSLEVLPLFKPGCASLVFIDGGHDFDTVLEDAQNGSKLVRQGGLLLFHDAADWSPVRDEVSKAIDRWHGRTRAGVWAELATVASIRSFMRQEND